MKKLTSWLFVLYVLSLFTSCGTYRYHHPTANPTLFHNAGEIQIMGDIGSSGISAKGAIALSGNIGITGMYNTNILEYRVKEGEFGFGYYKPTNPFGIFASGGLGFGSNFQYSDSTYTTKLYEGEFYRPYVQFNYGFDGTTIAGGLKGDLIFCLRAEYLFYDGVHLDGSQRMIRSKYFLLEPTLLMGLGSKNLRFDILVGFPFRPSFETLNSYTNARTIPATISIALRINLGRKMESTKN